MTTTNHLNIEAIRKEFPILSKPIYNKPYAYLDNAATTQKPKVVIDALLSYYSNSNGNVHRGTHFLSQEATTLFEESRKKVQKFICCNSTQEVIFTRGTTDSLNLIASSFGERFFTKGDEIILSEMEHHSNIIPWFMQAAKYGVTIKFIPFNALGELDIEAYKKAFTKKTKIVSICHISNALGTINPIKQLIDIAHSHHVPVVIDGAQSICHMPINVVDLDCDFFCFSGHKAYGPTGIGILYGKKDLLEQLPPYQGGGEMIETVTTSGYTLNQLPYRFEAGTPNIADAIALGIALDFILNIGFEHIMAHENKILQYAIQQLSLIKGIQFIGEPEHRSGVISFLIKNRHPFDMGTLIDRLGIGIRTGNHCAQTVMNAFNISGTMRASFALYNNHQEIDLLSEAIVKAQYMLQ